ncbi:MAG: hypothetical protein KGL39_20545 [Patescibacteria group bacterium]|nr:hypothetical protein [Patescibacteria group bacterium]
MKLGTETNNLKAEFAAALGCQEKYIQRRLIALGHETTCGRCGGCGQYSHCQMYGTTCFGCGGAGKVATKLTAGLLKTVRAEVAAGKLQPYIEATRAANLRRAKVRGAWDRVMQAWRANPTIAAHKGIHFTKQSARCTSINHFCAPLSDEVSKLVALVENGEWSTEVRRYVPVSDEHKAAAMARIAEIERLVADAETLAPDVVQ